MWKKTKNAPGRIFAVGIDDSAPVLEATDNDESGEPLEPCDSFEKYDCSVENAWQIVHQSNNADRQDKEEHKTPQTAAEHSTTVINPNGRRQSYLPGQCVLIHINNVLRSSAMASINDKSSNRDKLWADKFKSLLSAPNVDIERLRQHSWNGIPREFRSAAWKILALYMSCNKENRLPMLNRRRDEYWKLVDQHFDTRFDPMHKDNFRQISIDVPRMSPKIKAFQIPKIQRMFERILFIWAVRHPASGYVQGMNDLVAPFFVVFMSDFLDVLESNDVEVELEEMNEEILKAVEADSYWCASRMLEGVQDYYTFAQPGIQKKVTLMEDVIKRVDGKLHNHLMKNNVEFLQFAFRWMNNLLTRELPMNCVIRLWDTYHAEGRAFSELHIYVCVAFLLKFSANLCAQDDFQSLLLLLQSLPTKHWQSYDIDLLTADAYRLKYMFADCPNHLK